MYGGSFTKAVEHNTELQSVLHLGIKISDKISERLGNFVAHFYSQKCFKISYNSKSVTRNTRAMSEPCKMNGNLTELMSFFTGSDVHGLSAWQVALGCNKSRIFPTISVTELRGGAVYLNRK